MDSRNQSARRLIRLLSAAMIVGALGVAGNVVAETWPSADKEMAVRGCKESILVSAENGYLQRAGISESELPEDFREKITPSLKPVLDVCHCMIDEFEKIWTLERFKADIAGQQQQTMEFIRNGNCKMPESPISK